MLRKRLISILTFFNGVLYRSKLFTPDYRYTLNFVDAWSIDEIILLDITRPENKIKNEFYEIIKKFSKKSFVPMCVGGGIKTIEDCKIYLDLGADKVSINSVAHSNPYLITQAANYFGSSCVVISIDVKKIDKTYFVCTDYGRKVTKWKPDEFALFAQNQGAGEILLNSIDKDGSLQGYDNFLNDMVSSSVNIPVMVTGGAGNWQHFVDGFKLGNVDAVCTSNIYHFTEKSIKSAKNYLKEKGINVR